MVESHSTPNHFHIHFSFKFFPIWAVLTLWYTSSSILHRRQRLFSMESALSWMSIHSMYWRIANLSYSPPLCTSTQTGSSIVRTKSHFRFLSPAKASSKRFLNSFPDSNLTLTASICSTPQKVVWTNPIIIPFFETIFSICFEDSQHLSRLHERLSQISRCCYSTFFSTLHDQEGKFLHNIFLNILSSHVLTYP